MQYIYRHLVFLKQSSPCPLLSIGVGTCRRMENFLWVVSECILEGVSGCSEGKVRTYFEK